MSTFRDVCEPCKTKLRKRLLKFSCVDSEIEMILLSVGDLFQRPSG